MRNIGKIQFLDKLIDKIDEKKAKSICENDKSYSLIDRNRNRNKLLAFKKTGDYTKLNNEDVDYFTSLIYENVSSRKILKNVGQLKRVCECLNIPIPTSVPKEIVEMINIVLEEIESKTGDKIVILDPLSMTVATVEMVQTAIINITQLSDTEDVEESSNINQGLWYNEETNPTSYSLDIRECENIFEGVSYIELKTAKNGDSGTVTDINDNEYEYKIEENKILLSKKIQENKKSFDFSNYRKRVIESIADDENRVKKIYSKVYDKFDETDVILVYGMLFGKLKDYSEKLRDDIANYFINNPKSPHNSVLESKIQEGKEETISNLTDRFDEETAKEVSKAKKDFFIRTDIDGDYTKIEKKGSKYAITTLNK